jgi:hypothetical protein
MAGSTRSVRQRLAELSPVTRGMVLLLGIVEVVDGFRVVGPAWQAGDLLYHSALANAVVRGEIPPGGPYQGLPAYYPPLFHVMLAIPMSLFGLDAPTADRWLTLLWLPVLPIGTFLLARRITGRPWVAVLATALTCFAGGFDLAAGRLWVNSLFLSGQQAYPLYPRDVVFALLPFAVLAFLRALDMQTPARSLAWAALSGGLFGLAGLTQIQLLLPLPPALVAAGLVVALRQRRATTRASAVVLMTGIVAAVVIAPWLLYTIGTIVRNGGVGLDSSDMIEPARFGFWSYPREFGLLLPLGIVGAGVALLFLRRASGPRPSFAGDGRWRPEGEPAVAGGVMLVIWAVLAFALGVLYQPDWPLEDALRPQRLWLLASQPMTILAAIGLAAIAEELTDRLRRPNLLVPLVAVSVFVSSVPSTLATVSLVGTTWTRPTYADLDLANDRVPDFAALLGRTGPRSTVLTYEDWSALTWFETGSWVVALDPPGFAKLAYDPGRLTAHAQDARLYDLATAFDGAPRDLVSIADAYGASRIILARPAVAGDARLALFDETAAVAADQAEQGVTGPWTLLQGNGWDAVGLEAGSVLRLSLRVPGDVLVEVRVAGSQQATPVPARRFALVAETTTGTERTLAELTAAGTDQAWQRLTAEVQLQPGDHLAVRAIDALTVQSLRGYVAAAGTGGGSPIPGWRIAASTDQAVVLERKP